MTNCSSKHPSKLGVLERRSFGNLEHLAEENFVADVDSKQHVDVCGKMKCRICEKTIVGHTRTENIRDAMRDLTGDSRQNGAFDVSVVVGVARCEKHSGFSFDNRRRVVDSVELLVCTFRHQCESLNKIFGHKIMLRSAVD